MGLGYTVAQVYIFGNFLKGQRMAKKKEAVKVSVTVPRKAGKGVRKTVSKTRRTAVKVGSWLCKPRVSVVGLLIGVLVFNFFPIPAKWVTKIV